MKNRILSISFYLMALTAFGQPDKMVDAKIKSVTVFLSSAQVTREAKTRVEVGKTNLIIQNLSSQLDPQSIQVTGKGAFVILGISHQQNFLNEFNIPKALKLLKDSVEVLQRQMSLSQSQKEILAKEEQMLVTNQKIGGTAQNLSVLELKSMADFYRSRLTDIVSSRMKEDEKIKKINTRIQNLQLQLDSQNELYSRNTSEIVVSVSTDSPTPVELEVNYIVANAGWQPVYDVRAINTKSPLQLNYKANVFQSTGEEWKNVKLKLSTANPNLGGLKPELYTWYLDFYQPVAVRSPKYRNEKSASATMSRSADSAVEMESEEMVSASLSDFVTTVQTTLNTEFDIALPYTVASASKPTLVDIRIYDVKADYAYSVAPKLDADAFLMAKATGWEEYSLLPGEANIFFEGTFVGKTFIDPNNVKDTLSLSLGRDKRIVVKREKLKDLTSRKLIGTSQKENYAWEITVRNNKAEAVKINVEDQLPVSQNTQIEVTTIDTGGANYNKDSGKLNWNAVLQPNETKKFTYKFEVKYPKDRQVNGL